MKGFSQTVFDLVAPSPKMKTSWREVKASRKISRLASGLVDAQRNLIRFDDENAARLQALTKHKQRMIEVHAKIGVMIQYFRNYPGENTDEDLEVLEARDQALSAALSAIEKRFRVIQDRRKALATAYEIASTRLSECFPEIYSEDMARDADDVISDEMLQPAELDDYWEECLEFDDMLADKAAKARELDNGRPWVDQEYLQDEEELQQLKREWACASAEKQELEKDPNVANMQDKLHDVTQQVLALGVQLALRGMPVRNGKWLVDTPEGSTVSWTGTPIYQQEATSARKITPTSITLDVLNQNDDVTPKEEAEHQKGLFDSVTGIEKPSAVGGLSEEGQVAQAYHAVTVNEKGMPRVVEWLEVTGAESGSETSSARAELDDSLDNLDSLPEPDIKDSLSCKGKSTQLVRVGEDIFDLETRRQAWAIQLANDRRNVLKKTQGMSPWVELLPEIEAWY